MQRTALALAAASLMLLQTTAPAQAAAKPAAKQAQASAAGTQVWDLSQLYASDAAWDAERLALLAELPKIKALQGTLGQSAQACARAWTRSRPCACA